ncbi:MAG: Holliday junction resolvase RuvX [bacterium]|nr:Holliday junction resolvase RuvX [bacterium]
MFNPILTEDAEKRLILAIDWGERRIGLALSDDLRIMAHPYGTLANGNLVYQEITELVRERNVGLILIGLPLTLAGEEGEMAQKVRDFGAGISDSVPDIPLEYLDERMTTSGAKTALRESGKTAKEGKGYLDAIAAALLMETYLELDNQSEEPTIDE